MKVCDICGTTVLHLKAHQKSKKCMNVRNNRRSRSPSPLRSKFPVPKRSRSPSPIKSKFPSPKRSRSPSPKRSKFPSPKRSRSPIKSKFPSPKRSRSPIKSKFPSPKKRHRSPSPVTRVLFKTTLKTLKETIQNYTLEYDKEKCKDDCSICLEENNKKESFILKDCNHCFHKKCIEEWFIINPKCPFCNKIYGIPIGNMPPGTMEATLDKRIKLEGSRFSTIVIKYSIPDGIQKKNHENPGDRFSGTSRVCYLEASPEGYEILELLRRAFEYGLTFTIGQSLTTGKKNTVVWNGIHHKTSTNGGPSRFGFPDPTYYKRVKDELAYKGII